METARLRVFRDLLLSADIGNASVLTLLDLSAAFDAIDCHITLDRVQITLEFLVLLSTGFSHAFQTVSKINHLRRRRFV